MSQRTLTADVVAIKTMVITCYRCGAWQGPRRPLWYGTGDKGDSCHKCACTSVNVRDGRPIGPKSKWWEQDINEAEELLACFGDAAENLGQDIFEALIRKDEPPSVGTNQ